jgi:hypothetical protein
MNNTQESAETLLQAGAKLGKHLRQDGYRQEQFFVERCMSTTPPLNSSGV